MGFLGLRGVNMTVTKAEPRFDLDLKYGQEGERRIAEFFEWIATDSGRVEVKTKRYIDHKIYIETHCDKGRTGVFQPSGINVTTAAIWAICVGDTGVFLAIPTTALVMMLDDPSSTDKKEHDGSCPTRGKLINFCVLLYRLKNQRSKLTDVGISVGEATFGIRYRR